MFAYRTQVAAVVLAALSLVVYVLLPQPYSLAMFWLMLVGSLFVWSLSLWSRYRLGGDSADEARAELVTTVGFTLGFFVIGWLAGWFLVDLSGAWLIGFVAGIGGFVVALAPLRNPPDPPPPY
jgi:hypothetical protein